MQPPMDFQIRLSRLFNDRLRIRWSYQRHEWRIEYKVAPGQQLDRPVHSNDDRGIMLQDGYKHILSVRTGDRMPCPKCGFELKVPVMKLAEVTCDYCRLQGRDGRYPACYYPLEGNSLIEYLQRIDPMNTWKDTLALESDAINEKMQANKEKDFVNYSESVIKDRFKELMSIQSVGYTGKVFK